MSRNIIAIAACIAWMIWISPVRSQDFGPLAQPLGPVAGPYGSGAPVAVAGTDERPKDGRTIIESDAGASFDNASNIAEFSGHVAVHDPQFEMKCDTLHVVMRPDRKGVKLVVATGNVVIIQEKKNDRGDLVKSVGKCGKATYDPLTGDVTLEIWPQIQQGINNQLATEQTTVMILNAKGRSRTIGGSRTMIVDQGQKAVTP
jgi:lipopolysaccharide export system protein LptA